MTAPHADLSVPQLRSRFRGEVIGPDDSRYDAASAIYTEAFQRRPAIVIRPADPSDVATGITVARETGLELAVRGGGHSAAGHGVSDGVVLDLSGLRAIDIDVDGRTAWAQAGLTAAQYSSAVGEHGLATGFGDVGSVGIGGLTLGGGVGYLSRAYGLTVDDLLAAEVVTADGQALHVDADNYPDLFWALRGGGGNFGVVTRFQFRLHELSSVVGGVLMLPATPDIVHRFLAEAVAAPDELSAIVHVLRAPPMPFVPAEHYGELVVMAIMCYAGPAEAGERALAPFRALATPLVDLVQPVSYPAMFPPQDDHGEHPQGVGRTAFADTIDRDEAELLIERVAAEPSPTRMAQLRVMGGAVARVPDDATAYAHRQRRLMLSFLAFHQGADDRAAAAAWADDLATALRDGDGAYVNFLGDDGPGRLHEAYPGPTWQRLREIKRRYDPSNVFRLNHNIPPATNSAT